MPPRRLTRSGHAWSRGRAQRRAGGARDPRPGGKIQAFVLSPPNARKRPLPTILEIHGGPTWAWNRSPNHDTQDVGVRRLPRRPAEHPRLVQPRPRLDRRRCSATGAASTPPTATPCSTTWSRPACPTPSGSAATATRTAASWSTGWSAPATGSRPRLLERRRQPGRGLRELRLRRDVQRARRAWATTLTPEGIDSLWRQSPLRNVANINTPLLILQGEADLRCPPADNEQLFVALRALERDVEYVLYPGDARWRRAPGPTGASTACASSQAATGVASTDAERILAWFKKYL